MSRGYANITPSLSFKLATTFTYHANIVASDGVIEFVRCPIVVPLGRDSGDIFFTSHVVGIATT